MKNFRLILVGILVSVAGLQLNNPVQAAPIDNGSFMSLWSTYSHCQDATDIEQLKADASALTNVAIGALNQDGFVLPLPSKIEQFVSTPAARFAVDVKAMAAACSLRAGSAAVAAGKIDVAKDLLKTILNYQPQSEYAYYALQATALLSELETNTVQVTLHLP
mgnify:FL=1|jgi:hypothetical protein